MKRTKYLTKNELQLYKTPLSCLPSQRMAEYDSNWNLNDSFENSIEDICSELNCEEDEGKVIDEFNDIAHNYIINYIIANKLSIDKDNLLQLVRLDYNLGTFDDLEGFHTFIRKFTE